MTAKQLRDWQIYAELEPFDEQRQDVRIAQVVQTLVNIHRDPKKGKAVTIKDVLLEFNKPIGEMDKEAETPMEQWKRFETVFLFAANMLPRSAPVGETPEEKKAREAARPYMALAKTG